MFGFKEKSLVNASNPLEAKLVALRDKLGTLNANENNAENIKNSGGYAVNNLEKIGLQSHNKKETIGDDGVKGLSAAALQDENLVRETLKLVGVDYDALISMDAIKVDGAQVFSPYAKAVKANPAVAEHVLSAPQPVLAALQIALGFKPYAEFMDKYGDDPQKIRDAIRDEMKGELSATVVKDNVQSNTPVVSPFSANQRSGGTSKIGGSTKPKSLGEILKR